MRKFLSHLPSTFFKYCPLHIFYTLIVFFDLTKAIVSLFYLISSIALPTNSAQRIPFLIPIIVLVIFETTSACLSRWKGYIYNNPRLHMCYIISRILFIVGVIPLVTIGAGLGCRAQDSEAGMRCYQGLISGNAVWLTLETWFTYIVYKIYRKTVNGDYVIYGRPAVLGISLDPLPFQSTEDAPAVEVKGIRIVEEDKGKDKLMKMTTLASEGDIPINIERDLEKCEEKEVLDAIPVSIPIKKNGKKTKKVLHGAIEIVGDKNKAIKLEQVDLTILVKK